MKILPNLYSKSTRIQFKKNELIIIFSLFFYSIIFSGKLSAESILINSFTTSIEKQDDNVKKNIALAVEKLNGYVIEPEGSISFNDIVGEASVVNGYVSGRVFYWNEAVYEPGGGLCQVSTTLFNALLLSGFSIKERHKHSQPVKYAPPGLDATIFYGKKNLKMTNPFKQRFTISVSLTDSSLTFMIFGENKIPYHYDIETEEEEVEIPLLNVKKDRNFRPGYNVYVFRKKYSGDKLLENFLLYKDFVPPVVFK